MICQECGNIVEIDEVIAEESSGSMECYFCLECGVFVKGIEE